jgi:hypothetical protein
MAISKVTFGRNGVCFFMIMSFWGFLFWRRTQRRSLAVLLAIGLTAVAGCATQGSNSASAHADSRDQYQQRNIEALQDANDTVREIDTPADIQAASAPANR